MAVCRSASRQIMCSTSSRVNRASYAPGPKWTRGLALFLVVWHDHARSFRFIRAALAQLVEQHFCKVKVRGSNPRGGSIKQFLVVSCKLFALTTDYWKLTTAQRMSQDNLIKLECTACRKVNYHSSKNKKTIKARLEIAKFCKTCEGRTVHKETK